MREQFTWRSAAWRVVGAMLGLAASAVVMFATGNDVVGFVEAMASGLGPNLESTLRWFAPLLLAGIAAAIAFRDGALNLGLDGQIYVGGAASAAVALGLAGVAPPIVVIGAAIAAGAVAGATVAGIAAAMRLCLGTPEVITTLVLNPLCALFVTWLVSGPLVATGGNGNTESSSLIPSELWLPALGTGTLATISLYVALATLVCVGVYYRYTTWGFESRIFGASPEFSFYSGVPNVAVFLRAMLASGGIAGVVGTIEVLGVQHRLAKGFNPGLGFDGIAVALVAGLSIGGLGVVALLFALMRQAGEVAQITLGIPAELVDVMIALIIITTSLHLGVRFVRRRVQSPEVVSLSPPPDQLSPGTLERTSSS